MDEHPVLDELLAGTFSPLETIEKAVEIGLRRNTRAIGVEGTAYQSTLLFWFDHYCREQGITGFHFIELSPKGQAKNNRIKRGLIRLCSGEIYLHPRVRSLVFSQITDWNPLKVNNTDDIIDPIGYVEEFVRDHGTEIVRSIYEVEYSTATASHSPQIPMAF